MFRTVNGISSGAIWSQIALAKGAGHDERSGNDVFGWDGAGLPGRLRGRRGRLDGGRRDPFDPGACAQPLSDTGAFPVSDTISHTYAHANPGACGHDDAWRGDPFQPGVVAGYD